MVLDRMQQRRTVRAVVAVVAAAAAVCAAPASILAQSLRGSRASLARQNQAARRHDFSYLTTSNDVDRFVRLGLLVPVRESDDLTVDEASFRYARPEVRSFLVRLARNYHQACGGQLVVTSLTRPERRQPWNASDRSVHPTGMATDIRRTNDMRCRGWLEATLLHLEDAGVVEATRERRPPHYHVAVFPRPFEDYVASGGTIDPSGGEGRFHLVRSGETLGEIAERYGTTIRTLRRENRLRSSRIYVGQVLRIPRGR